jgi:hypothetical protein
VFLRMKDVSGWGFFPKAPSLGGKATSGLTGQPPYLLDSSSQENREMVHVLLILLVLPKSVQESFQRI